MLGKYGETTKVVKREKKRAGKAQGSNETTQLMPGGDVLQVTVKSAPDTSDSGTQYDMSMFFEYIFDFLKAVEDSIRDGEVMAQMIKDDPKEHVIDLDAEIRKSQAKLGELSKILGHIASFRNKHGDQLFQGLAQAFTAINPKV